MTHKIVRVNSKMIIFNSDIFIIPVKIEIFMQFFTTQF